MPPRLKKDPKKVRLKAERRKVRLKEPPDLFKNFDPFKGTVPVPQQLNYQDAADRARELLKGWTAAQVASAAAVAVELHNEGSHLLEQDLRRDGTPSYSRPTKTIYRAKNDRLSPITADGRELRDSEIFAAFALFLIASVCDEIKRLDQMPDTIPDIAADDMRRVGQSYVEGTAVFAQAAVERAERMHEQEERERAETDQRRHKAQKAGLSRKRAVRQYQWGFIQAWDAGRYKGRSRPQAAKRFLSDNPPPLEVYRLQDPERTLVDALKRHQKNQFTPPEQLH